MSQRHEPADSLDDFPTPPWATRALCNWIEGNARCLDGDSAWDPACGRGDMTRTLAEYFDDVIASDVFDYDGQTALVDFLSGVPPRYFTESVEWVITNPPFRLGRHFAIRALSIARVGVALLVRTQFLESRRRFDSLFAHHPPAHILQFVERVPMVKGRLDRNASTATSYCWIVWVGARRPTLFHWLPPCRSKLERDSDYK